MNKNELNIKFTGKATVIVELEEHGPIQFNINDMNIVLNVVNVLLINDTTKVDAYTKAEEKRLTSILNKIK